MGKTIYKKIIDFLVKYYSGTISWKWDKWYMSGGKLGLATFFGIWILLKLFLQGIPTGITWFTWWDGLMFLLLVPQALAAMSMFAVNEQKRLNSENENK